MFGPLWMLSHRMWLVLVGYVGVSAALEIIFSLLGTTAAPRIAAGFLLAVLVGMEAATLRRFTLGRRRWTNLGVIVADDLEAAERRFFDVWVKSGGAATAHDERVTIAAARAGARCHRTVSAARNATRDQAVSVAIVDYGSGNLHSAAKAFERAARECGHEQPIVVTSDPDKVARADRVVLPGVGAFADCRRGLDAVSGMVDALNMCVRQQGRPFLGICVGMQLMAERGREYEVTEGLGWIPGEVDRITPSDPNLKIPHMGWNTLNAMQSHPLLDGIAVGPEGLHAYFVHSFELKPAERNDLVAQAEYGGPVTAIVGRDTMVGTQFHPEKSQRLGLKLIANFLKWTP